MKLGLDGTWVGLSGIGMIGLWKFPYRRKGLCKSQATWENWKWLGVAGALSMFRWLARDEFGRDAGCQILIQRFSCTTIRGSSFILTSMRSQKGFLRRRMPWLALLFNKMIMMGEEAGTGRLVRRQALWSQGRRLRVPTRAMAVAPEWEGAISAQEKWLTSWSNWCREERKEGGYEDILSLAWAAGRLEVSLTEIGKTEGRADFVGEDGDFGFGCAEFEMHMGNPTALFSRQTYATGAHLGALSEVDHGCGWAF